MNIKSYINIKLTKFKKFFKNSEKVKFILEFFFYSLIYGLAINYMLWGVFNIPFIIFKFPAYGILAYIIKEELPLVILRMMPIRR